METITNVLENQQYDWDFLNAILQDVDIINRNRTIMDMDPVNLETLFTLAELEGDSEWMNDDEMDFDLDGNRIPVVNSYVGSIVTCSFPISSEEKEKIQKEEIDCPICLDSITKWDSISLMCRHSFCSTCVSSHLNSFHCRDKKLNKPCCSLCRTDYVFLDIPNPENAIELEKVLRK
jgi:hypothetical protein